MKKQKDSKKPLTEERKLSKKGQLELVQLLNSKKKTNKGNVGIAC